MSTMRPSERREWAKEEIAEAVKAWLADKLENDQSVKDSFDDSEELKKQVRRVLNLLGKG